jgi:CTP synthase
MSNKSKIGHHKYIFIIGCNSIITASIGYILQSYGLKINITKIHKPTKKNNNHFVFITDNSLETDISIGYYNIFTNNNYNEYDITICEVNVDSIDYILKMKNEMYITIYTADILFSETTKKYKYKPIQKSLLLLMKNINVDMIICNYDTTQYKPTFIKKLPLNDIIIVLPNVDNKYMLPYIYMKQNIHKKICEKLNIMTKHNNNIMKIYKMINKLNNIITINVLIRHDYMDTYIMLEESLKHAAYNIGKDIKLNYINVKKMNKTELIQTLQNNNNALIIPGGFGKSGVEKIITGINYARTNNIPTLGICYGMQMMAIEFARNIIGIKNANTQEIDTSSKSLPIIHIIKKNENKKLNNMMRIGNYEGYTIPETMANNIYKNKIFIEKHGHYYEINTKYKKQFEDNGYIFSGISKVYNHIEITEIPKLKFYMGVQFHPEFNSSILKPHEIILAFMKAAYKYSN